MDVTTRLASRLGAPDTRGALIASIYRPGVAWQAGLRPGDIVVEVNGTPIEDPGHLTRTVADAPIGSTAHVTVIRSGDRVEVEVPVSKLDRRAN
jgi:S1-C subfamily serine protease